MRPVLVTLLAAATAALAASVALAATAGSSPSEAPAVVEPTVRTYFIQAEPVRWNYAPQGRDQVTGKAFGPEARVFVERGEGRIGRRYLKSHYVAYTDATFTSRAPVSARWRHLGILGPTIHAQVGDTIRVVFRNRTPFAASVHPHGVLYDKANEGAPYGRSASLPGNRVKPGATYTYTWQVPDRAGPGPMDGSSVAWMYHSHVDEVADTNAGLVGPLIVTARGRARPDGSPVDVDRELVSFFSVLDENASPWLPRNVATAPGSTAAARQDPDGFAESNLMHSVNGFVYGNGPGFSAIAGERVRWYLMSLGNEVDLHTPHWHGQTVTVHDMRTDMAELLPGSMMAADMQPDAPGTWLYHCHVNDHLVAGMQAIFTVRQQ